MRAGKLDWIGISESAESAIRALDRVELAPGMGVTGDYHMLREVTLIQAEHLKVVEALLGKPVKPEQLRRNLVVSGLNLQALEGTRFQIGEALLEAVGSCPPCERMEENLGTGGLDAMCGHGGITAKVVEGGSIGVGDEVRRV